MLSRRSETDPVSGPDDVPGPLLGNVTRSLDFLTVAS